MRPASTCSAHARGDHRADSNVDLFIGFDPDRKVPSLLAIIGLERRLAEALGLAVTITTRGSLHPLMKDAIERDAIRIG